MFSSFATDMNQERSMRRYLAAFLAVWLGVTASSTICASSWIPQDDALANVDLAGRGFGAAIMTATDAYDGSVWVATGASLLLHFARDGSLRHGTTLSAPAAALATDLDQSTWLVANRELLHFARDGTWLATHALGLGDDESVTSLVIDALRDRVWIATNHGIYRTGRSTDSGPSSATLLRGEATALALDPRSGVLLAIVDGFLIGFDIETKQRRELSQVLIQGEQAVGLLYEPTEAVFIVETTAGLLRIASDGRVLERLPTTASAIVWPAPFRIEPTLALVRPPDGGATTDVHGEVMLRVGASCNGTACDVPFYVRNLRVDASLGGVSLGEPVIDAASGRTIFPQRPSMRQGGNELSARVVDAFGHQATLDRVRWTLLASATNATETTSEPVAVVDGGAPVAKAANKAPTVSMTSPVSGNIFSVGGAITLTATAADIDGSIAKVEFYRGGTTLIGTATAAPYRYDWLSAAAGNYSLTAKAYDNRNGTATSVPVTIVVANNQLPVVTMTSPAADSFVVAESNISVGATASDPDGTVARVEFFDGATSIAATAEEPYQVTWHATSPGVHLLSARATDDKGGTRQSSPIAVTVGGAPVVIVTSPAACAFIDGPLDVALAADAMSTGGRVMSVEFFDGASSVGMASGTPWRSTLVNASTGSHSITAKATDDHGLTTTSRAATFTIRGTNQPPSVALTSPSEGAKFAFGSTVSLTATATDSDGSIVAVEFRNGSATGSLLGRATSAPYAASWTNMAAGSYAVVAVAYDDRNATTTSAPVHVTIDANVLPTVALTAPVANARFTAPASIAIAANASDSDGTIAKVEFYAGTMLIGSSSSAPYTATWSNVGSGSYSITARATDNIGGVAVSAAVPITVVNNALPTVALTAPSPGGQYFAPATISLSATAADSDGTIANVQFYANGALIGTSTTVPYGMVWDSVAGGTYSLMAKATDNAGGTATSSAVNITIVGAPVLNIDSKLANATIDDDNVLVRGFVSAPANSAVTVNGAVTHVDDFGFFQANDVPLTPGANSVTAIVTTQDGQSTSQSITINSSGAGAFVVHASPTEGLDSLQVTFTVENPGNVPFKQINFDLDNDGFPNLIATAAQFFDGKLTVTATYPAGTWLAVIKVFDDQDHVIYSTSKSIVVFIPSMLQGNLRAIYDGMLSRLRAGNIAGALTAFTGSAYDKYNAIFTQLQGSLATIVDQLGEISEINFGEDLAEFSVIRNTANGPQRFMLYMIRAEDGIWRIDGM
jgi:hypothetical protein